LQLRAPGTEAREVEQLGQEALHPIGAAADGAEQLLTLVGAGHDARVEEQADAGTNRRQRRAQLVADGREQLASKPFELLQPDGELGIG
jgi:hypothetical protein